MTPPNKGWKDILKERGEDCWSRNTWAEYYVDDNDNVVFSGTPHFELLSPTNDKTILNKLTKYVMERQGSLPPIATSGSDNRINAESYLQWYEGWKRKGLLLKPAGVRISSTRIEEEIGNNYMAVEFVPKVDYLKNWKNGNVSKTTIKDGCKFVNSLIDFFLKNPYGK